MKTRRAQKIVTRSSGGSGNMDTETASPVQHEHSLSILFFFSNSLFEKFHLSKLFRFYTLKYIFFVLAVLLPLLEITFCNMW